MTRVISSVTRLAGSPRPCIGPPGERPRYHPRYYSAYDLDPDGNNIEVVNHHQA